MDERYVFLTFPAIGLVLLVIGVVVWLRTRRFVSEALRTQGTVVGLAARRGSKGSTTFAPVVVFSTREGVVHEFTDPMSSSPPGYSVGQQVEVLYHWQNHSRARLASKFRLYFVPALLSFIGLLFTAIGGLIVLHAFGGRDALW